MVLRNSKTAINGFINQDSITPEEQIKYMKVHNDSYYICIEDNIPVGFIGSIDNDIRIAVIEQYRKKGIGKFMLNEFMNFNPDGIAKVKIDNIASINLFKSCGFYCYKKDFNFIYFKK